MPVERTFIKVDQVEGPGDYRIASDPRKGSFEPPYLSGDPTVLNRDLVRYLKERCPEIWSAFFSKAHIDSDGNLVPAKIEYFPDWRNRYGREVIGYGGQVYTFGEGDNSSHGGGVWSFAIKDVGNLMVVKNELAFADPIGRDGEIRVNTSGHVPHHSSESHYTLNSSIHVTGEKPGTLVQAVKDYVNDFIMNNNYPLWRQTSVVPVEGWPLRASE